MHLLCFALYDALWQLNGYIDWNVHDVNLVGPAPVLYTDVDDADNLLSIVFETAGSHPSHAQVTPIKISGTCSNLTWYIHSLVAR